MPVDRRRARVYRGGRHDLSSGRYHGTNLAGTKIAYATVPGEWVRLYVDTPRPGQQQAASAFARAVYTAFGPIEAVKPAKIGSAAREAGIRLGGWWQDHEVHHGAVLGGDKRTPISISNIHDPLHPTVMQGKTINGTYQDGERSFTLKDSNSYFTDRMRSRGQL